MASNFNTSGLADFTAANPQKALSLVILGGIGTKDYFSVETGVKYQTKIPNITNVDVDISTGAISGYNTGSGQTTIVDVTLQDTQLKIFETYSKEALNKTIMASLGTKGTDPSELPAEDLILALKGKKLHLENEKLIWTDAKVKIASTGGVLQQLTDASTWLPSGIAGVAFSGITDASILAAVNAVVTKMEGSLPEYVQEEMILAMSPENLSRYGRALYNLNGTVTTQTVGADGKPIVEIYIPGTNVKAVAMIGLTGKNDLVLSHPLNIIQVVDLVDESDYLSFIFSPFARWFELAAQYKLGVKVVDASKVVKSN
jgi:hypothetical protein